jgi:hypothetical protein
MCQKATRLFELIAVLALLVSPGGAAPPGTALAAEPHAPAQTWVVNNSYDEAGSCTPSSCSLRQAVQAASSAPGTDTITFNIPQDDPGYSDGQWTITLDSPLPSLGEDPLTIDAASLCGGCQPCVVIDAHNVSYGFAITSANKTLSGLTIRNAQVHGVYIYGTGAQSNTLTCSSVISNTGDGVRIGTSAFSNTIGPDNLISGNGDDGVEITNLAHHNVVAGNLIGTDAAGNAAWANGGYGVHLSNGALTNTIGLTTTAGSNHISANSLAGILIASGAQTTCGNVVQNNTIGTDAAGNDFLPNHGGVIINDSPDNVVGPDNLISGQNYWDGVLIQGSGATGNVVTGNYIGTNAAGTAALNNDDGVVISNAVNNTIGPDNVISGNYRDGVRIEGGGAFGNVVKGNSIGTNAAGTGRVSNKRFGLLLQNEAHHNVIGETFEPNVISGNGYDGDYPQYGGVGIFGSNYNQLCHNKIGTTASGFSALPNGWHGVWLAQSAHDNAIGEGISASCANTIAWNEGDGVYVHGGGTVHNIVGYVNSIHSNQGLGINDDAGGNTELPPPVIVQHAASSGYVSLEGTACPGCTVLIYSDDDGEGRSYETYETADATTGRFSWNGFPLNGAVTVVAIDAYSNTSEFAGPPVRLNLSIDDALPHMTVNKLPGDADPPAGNTIVELVARITSFDSTLTQSLQVDVQVPSDVLGSPTRVLYRDQLADYDGTAVSWSSPSAGIYRVQGIDLLDSGFGWWERRVVFRFAIPHATTPTTLTLQGWLTPPAGRSVGQQGTDWAKLRLLKQAGEIIITNRTVLYSTYAPISYQVTSLLWNLYAFAQGPPANWSPLSVIYYVDAYDPSLATWDNTQVDYTDEDTANVAAELIDDMIEDWVEDSPTAYVQYCSWSYGCHDHPVDAPSLLIAGDDHIIPFHRRKDPTDSEEGHAGGAPNNVLKALRENGYFFTENGYANLAYVNDDFPWDEGGVELDTGRLIGSTPDVMSAFLTNGVASPSMAGPARAIVVSAGGSDAAEVAERLVDHGYNVLNDTESPDTVNDGDWQESDLVALMQGDYQILHHHHHANEGEWCTPPGDCGGALTVAHLFSAALGLGNPIGTNRPVFTSGGCRAGLSPARPYENTMASALVTDGASAVMASTGIAYYDSDYGDLRGGEEFLREFWVRAIRPQNGTLSLGAALHWTKRYWDGHWSVDDEEAKTGSEFVLYGVPWVTLYDRSASPLVLQEAAPAQTVGPGAITPPQPLGEQTYVVTATFDASGYTVRQVDGFDLVEVPGMPLGRDYRVPLVPLAEAELQLPFDGLLLEVEAIRSDPVDLGSLNIPAERPGIPIPGGDPGGLEEAPSDVGLYPPQPAISRTVTVDGYNLARVYASPLSYDAATDEAVLYQGLALRITYHLSSTVAMVGLAAGPADLAPGQPFLVAATLSNPSAETAVLTGTLVLENDLGQVVAVHEIAPFEAPGGAQHLLQTEWLAPDAEGAYSLFLKLWHAGTLQVIGHRRLQVSGRRITRLDVPDDLSPGQQADFAVTFANRRGTPFEGQVTLSIYDATGVLVAMLEAPIEVGAQAEGTVSLFLDTSGKPVGRYTVAAQVTGENAVYGPLQDSFDLWHAVFLPLILCNKS